MKSIRNEQMKPRISLLKPEEVLTESKGVCL